MNTRACKKSLILIILLITASISTLYSQSEAGRMSFGFNFGGVKYWGEFSDNQFWLAGDLFLRYNILANLSLNASAGLANMRYKVDQDVLAKYPDYFGNNATVDITGYKDFPKTIIRDKNSVRINTYEVYLSFNLFASQFFVPYFFAGAGWMNWEPKAGDTGYEGALPNNANSKYTKNKIEFPVGFGFEAYISDNLVLNGKGTFRFTGTDYLDDYQVEGTDKDAFITFGLGFSYYIFGDADYDKDGLTNSHEREIGTDPRNPDTDGDGLKDGQEVKDYFTNPLKPDTDGDNLTDYDEVMKYKTSPINPDTDSDKLNDGEEIARQTNPLKSDTDGDGLIDGDETAKYNTDPLNPDTDGDGLKDGDEVLRYNTNPKLSDTDADHLSDYDEIMNYKTNPLESDTDGDKLKDGDEVLQYKTDPLRQDTDSDGLTDGEEVLTYNTNPVKQDTDDDSLNDGDEVRKYQSNPLIDDTDKDGLNDGEEVLKYQTDPVKPDTDGDKISDGDEVKKYRTSPIKMDTDEDNLNDFDEIFKYKTNPLIPDTDGDTLADGEEVNRTHTDPLKPDTDDDTIIDSKDDCPLVAGVPSLEKGKNGCPEPPKVGTKTDFPDILFIVNSDQFNFDYPGTALNLAKLLEYINQCPQLSVFIEGHSSEEGKKARNNELSDLRAKKVISWLIAQGVAPEKLSGSMGYGSSQPKIKEPTGKALKKISKDDLENIRKQNRRITVKVVKTCS